MFFQHFASKNQLPGLSISGKLIENGLIYNDNRSSFTELNDVSPKLVSDCFNVNNMIIDNTRNKCTFYSQPVRTVLHGTESLPHLGPKIWEFTCASHALSGPLKIFLRWIFNLSKTFNFTKTIKDNTNWAAFTWVRKQPWNSLRWGTFLNIFKTWKQLNFFVLSFFISSTMK